ncbi:hypothetical protein GCM10027022_04140 [Alpinimonas psychrophila]|uniref:Ig-like domain-containing protein n=1 Tax=Alpinimonas psychrophila TaxID=748908 RepID=UPI0015F7F7B2
MKIFTLPHVSSFASLALVGALLFAVPGGIAAATTNGPIALGSAASFSALSPAGLTISGNSTFPGDVGVAAPDGILTSDGAATIGGQTHNLDAVSLQALADARTAYTEARSRTATQVLPGDLIGLTLTPGVYHSVAAVGQTGALTLDAGGDANAVFIFQIDAALNTTAGVSMNLANGAKASNVFWQVAGAVTTGAGSHVVGTFLAKAAVTLGAGTNVAGRTISTDAAVTIPASFFTGAMSQSITTVSLVNASSVTTNNATPTISGTTDAQPGDSVSVSVENQNLNATVTASGTWSVNVPTPLSDGTHAVVVTVSNSAGSSVSANQALTIDTTPDSITLSGAASRSVGTQNPTVSGTTTAPVSSNVSVTVGVHSLTTTVQPDGSFSVALPSLVDGVYTVTATVTDTVGNTGSATQALTVDTTVDTVSVDGGFERLVASTTPTISGTTGLTAGAFVGVTVAGQSFTALVGAEGHWSIQAATLSQGAHDVVATATDAAGNVGSFTQVLTVDTVADAVTIDGGVTVNVISATPTVSGTSTAPAGTTVTLTVSPALSVVTTTVLADSTFSVALPALSEGQHDVVASVTDAAGNVGTFTQALTVDTTADTVAIDGGLTRSVNTATSTVAGTTSAPDGSTVVVSVAGQVVTATVTAGLWSVQIAALTDGIHDVVASVTDAAGNVGTFTQALTVDTTADTVALDGGATLTVTTATPHVSGTTSAPVGSTVTVAVTPGLTVVTATVLADSTFSVALPSLVDGMYAVTVSVTDAAGNTGSATQTLTIDTTAETIGIDGGFERLVASTTPTISGTTGLTAGAFVGVTVAGQSFTALVGAGGHWSIQAAVLTQGAHDVVATATDAAGNIGTSTQTLTVDTIADNVTIDGGLTVNVTSATPTVSGTSSAPAGSTVVVTAAGQVVSTTVTAGLWSVQVAALTDGAHDVVASVTDAAGNVATVTQTLTVDTATAPPAVDTTADTVAIDGGLTRSVNTATSTVAGTTSAPDGSTVVVSVAGQVVTATVTAGLWSVQVAALTDGIHDVVASVTDAAGNVGTFTQALTVDTTADTVALDGGATLTVTTATPHVSGTTSAPVGSTVTVAVSPGLTFVTATVLTDSTFSVALPSLVDGVYAVTASVIDAAGNTGSATQTLTVDTVVVPPVESDTTADTVALDGGATLTVTTATPHVSGTTSAPVGSTVTVAVTPGLTVVTATVLADSTFFVALPAISDGVYAVTASVIDAAGNTGSATQTLTVDTTNESVALDGGLARLVASETPTITGTTGLPSGSVVGVSVAGQNLTAIVGAGGHWSIQAAALTQGAHDVVATVTDGLGNIGTFTQTLTVDTIADTVSIDGGLTRSVNTAASTVSGTTSAPAGSTVVVSVAGQVVTAMVTAGLWSVQVPAVTDGTHNVVASVTDAAGNVGTFTQALTIDTTVTTPGARAVTVTGGAIRLGNDSTPTISGTSELPEGSPVQISIDTNHITTNVGPVGTWSYTPEPLTDGVHILVVSVTDTDGTVKTFTQVLTIDTTPDLLTIAGGVTLDVNNTTPTVSGTTTAPEGSTVVVRFAGQVLTASVNTSGTWAVTSAVTLAEGSYRVEASTTDVAGNTAVATQTLTVDTTAETISINGGAVLAGDDDTPTLSGTSGLRAGSIVNVLIDDVNHIALVQEDGGWSYTSAPLAEGVHIIVISATDAAGNTSSLTQTLTITLVPVATLTLNLSLGGVVAGAETLVSASNMMPDSPWTLTMHSSPVIVATGFTDATGAISYLAHLPNQVEVGAHRLILDAVKPDGALAQITAYLNINSSGNLTYSSDVANPESASTGSATPTTSPSPTTSSAAALASASVIPTPQTMPSPQPPQSTLATAQASAACIVADSVNVNSPSALSSNIGSSGHRGTSRLVSDQANVLAADAIAANEACITASPSADLGSTKSFASVVLDAGGVAGALSALAAFGFIFIRRRRNNEDEEELVELSAE